MITSKQIEEIYTVNPFDPEFGVAEGLDLGIDVDEIGAWAMEKVIPAGEYLLENMGNATFATLWISGFRVGFFLGRGYVEDGTTTG